MPTAPDTAGGPLYQTTSEVLSEPAFRVIIWLAIGICAAASLIRYGIRLICWRRLLVEDYLMVVALFILVAIAGVLNRYIGDIYYFTHVENGVVAPGPDFQRRFLDGLRADGIVLVIGAIGLYTIKFNFLFFFYRLGHHIRTYQIAWGAAVFFVAASLAVNLGVIPYKCSFGSLEQITVQCATTSSVSHIYDVYKLTIALDAICDAVIIAFPVVITWRTKMNLHQKLVLSGVFLLVAFTIAVTVIRGSIFGGVYKDVKKTDRKVFDTAWVLFWLYVEYFVSFLINCIISFRSLWVNQKQKAKDDALERDKQRDLILARQADNRLRSKWQAWKGSLLDTLAHLEGTTFERDSANFIQLTPPSGNMTVDFSNWGNPLRSNNSAKLTTGSSPDDGRSQEVEHHDSFEQLAHMESNTLNQSNNSSGRH